jgi:hypothetical protein
VCKRGKEGVEGEERKRGKREGEVEGREKGRIGKEGKVE